MGEGLWTAAVVVAALLPPAVALGRHLGRDLRPTERLLAGAALAPAALAAPALLLAWLVRLPLAACFWQAELAWLVAALWPRRRPGTPPPGAVPPGRGGGFPAPAALLAAGTAALLVAGVAFANPFVRLWSDAWFHAAAAGEIARHGVPPQDPTFAGVPFYYFWFHHFVLALLTTAAGASPFDIQALVNVWAAAIIALGAAHVAYRVFGRGAAMWAGWVVVFGLNPLGWALWIAKGVTGETRGWVSMIEHLGTTNGAGEALAYAFPFVHASLLNRLWTGTALTPALALALVLGWALVRGLRVPSLAAWLRAALLALALLAVHPAFGALALVAFATGLGVAAVPRAERARALAFAAALAAAGVAAWPYVRMCSLPGAWTPGALGLYAPNLGSLALAAGPWWLVAAPAAGLAWRAGAAGRLVLGALVAAVAIAAALVLPERNSEKSFYLVWLLLAPFAAAGFLAWTRRARVPGIGRVALLLVLAGPTTLLFTLGFAFDARSPGVLWRGERPATRRLPLETAAEAAAHRWIRDHTADDAILLERPQATVNEPAPVLAGRRAFCGALDIYLANHFGGGAPRSAAHAALLEEFRVRRAIQRQLFESGPLELGEQLYLESLAAPVYLVVRRFQVDPPVWGGFRRQRLWREVYRNEEVRIYRFSPAAAAAPRRRREPGRRVAAPRLPALRRERRLGVRPLRQGHDSRIGLLPPNEGRAAPCPSASVCANTSTPRGPSTW